MNTFLEFINNNYIWLIIIFIILLLALIGYIAEKQGFKVNSKSKKENNIDKKEKIDKIEKTAEE